MTAPRIFYRPTHSSGAQLCQPIDDDDFETIITTVNGVARGGDWHPVAVKIIRDDEGVPLVPSDSPWLGAHALIFDRQAAEALAPILAPNGELLPLACADMQVAVYNPLHVLDVLDRDRSALDRYPDGRIMYVGRYVLRPGIADDVDIFKIPDLRNSPTFVSQHFVDSWTSHGLTGLDFDRVDGG